MLIALCIALGVATIEIGHRFGWPAGLATYVIGCAAVIAVA